MLGLSAAVRGCRPNQIADSQQLRAVACTFPYHPLDASALARSAAYQVLGLSSLGPIKSTLMMQVALCQATYKQDQKHTEGRRKTMYGSFVRGLGVGNMIPAAACFMRWSLAPRAAQCASSTNSSLETCATLQPIRTHCLSSSLLSRLAITIQILVASLHRSGRQLEGFRSESCKTRVWCRIILTAYGIKFHLAHKQH